MVDTSPGPTPQRMWVYAYQLVPPQRADRLGTVQPLLDEEQRDARRSGRTWAGRIVLDERITHILIVSDSPAQNQEANRNLESALKELKAEFTVSPPIVLS